MLRLFTVTIIGLLACAVLLQHAYRGILLSELEAARQEKVSLELTLAHAQGRLLGIEWATEERDAEIRSALLESRDLIADLRLTVRTREHYIASLEEGQMLMVTAYNADAAQTDDTPNITANNNQVRPGIIAVSRDLFSQGWVFGRQVYVKGMGVYTIDDLMHQRKRNQVDIFMESHSRAVEFGRQTRRVYLLGDG